MTSKATGQVSTETSTIDRVMVSVHVFRMYIIETMNGSPLAEAMTLEEATAIMVVMNGHRVVSADDGVVVVEPFEFRCSTWFTRDNLAS